MVTATTERTLVQIVLLGFLAACGYVWWVSSGSMMQGSVAEQSIVLGRLLGIGAQLMLLLQVLLVARIPLVEQAFGFDKMNVVHRFVGFSVLVFLITHPLLLAYGYAFKNEVPLSAQLFDFIQSWHDVVGAAVAVFLYLIIGLTSWHIVRYRMKYEYWYGVHFLTYAALFMGFGHQMKFGTFSEGGFAAVLWVGLMCGTVGLFLLFRWLDPLYLSWKHKLRVEKVMQESANVVSVYVSGRRMDELHFIAGQYTSWRFHHGSIVSQLRTGFFFPHPFSFSQDYNGTNLRITVKALGDFTKQLPGVAAGTRVTIGRPRGHFVLPKHENGDSPYLHHAPKVLGIAGGVGITPLRAMAEAANKARIDYTLLYTARTVADFALLDECKKYATHTACYTSDSGALDPKNNPTPAVGGAGFTFGMLDAATILRECPDVRERECYVCGPGPMMDAMITALKSLGVPAPQIHFERFGY